MLMPFRGYAASISSWVRFLGHDLCSFLQMAQACCKAISMLPVPLLAQSVRSGIPHWQASLIEPGIGLIAFASRYVLRISRSPGHTCLWQCA